MKNVEHYLETFIAFVGRNCYLIIVGIILIGLIIGASNAENHR